MASAKSIPVQQGSYRWLQLLFGVVCMVMIANLQYGWTNFVNPIDQKFHWGSGGDPGGVQHLRCAGDLAYPARRMAGR